MKKKQTAIVTGGAGFIGSHMVDLLLSKNFKVIVIDNLAGGHLNNIKQHLKNKDFNLKKIDITKSINIKNFKKIDYIFHFAGIGDIIPSIENPTDYMKTNVQGTVNILEVARKMNIKKLVYAASASCYGKTKNIVTEKNKIFLEHPYALSKYLGERSVFHWHKVYGLPINAIRIFNAYGPRVRTTGAYGAVIGVFFKQKISNKPLTIVGDGKQSRDFVHVTDVVRAFYKAALVKRSGEFFNIGTGNPQTVNYLAKLVGGKTINIPNRPGEPMRSCANITKAKNILDWKPLMRFDQGIKEMLNDINKWKDAPLWTPNKIKNATKNWFNYLK
ncbi:SDR family NAD(P)-dependent oxidoreductase [Pelagibacteraceae bacterium]|jgi:UDP-glucose 4-epimerase|nr:SDR family NAD(P)-dependent oxidoreductase [Pelagibacteraceae bacterium]